MSGPLLVGGSAAMGLALGAIIGLYAIIGPAPAVGAVRIDPNETMVDRMRTWGEDRGGLYVEAECYAAPPVTACIATYLTPTRKAQVPWVTIDGPSGPRVY